MGVPHDRRRAGSSGEPRADARVHSARQCRLHARGGGRLEDPVRSPPPGGGRLRPGGNRLRLRADKADRGPAEGPG